MNFTLNQSSHVITPNQRLSKYLLNHYKKQTLEAPSSKQAFYNPAISSLDAWLRATFECLQEHYPFEYQMLQVINAEQEKLLWQEVILNSQISKNLLLQKNCAQDVMQAYALCEAWQINTNNIESSHYSISIDQTCFLEWKEIFENLCTKKNLLPSSRIITIVNEAIEKKRLSLNEEYIFYGFDELTPSQLALQEKLKSSGALVNTIGLPKNIATYQRILKCNNFDDEVILAGEWAKAISGQFPDAKIAIVIPSLAENRQHILNNFLKILKSDSYIAKASIYPLPFNISSGIPLSNVPLVKAALLCFSFHKLQLFNETIDSISLSETIRNTFIFSDILSNKERLFIEKKIKDRKELEFTHQQLIKLITKIDKDSYFATLIKTTLADTLSISTNKSHAEWRSIFIAQLENLSWLKNKVLDSESFQASKKFIETLDNLANLDDCLPPCSFKQALNRLEELLRNNLFQADSLQENKNNIHILGSLEAAGQDFTHLWLCEMHDKTWPAKARPNPFLSSGLQKELNMPHSSAQRELDFCQKITERFQHHCNNIIFSYGEFDQDEQLNPSPLLKSIISLEKNQLIIDFKLILSDSMLNKIFMHQKIEFFDDAKNLAISNNESPKGGQSIIKQQAQCPFSAFAAHRLKIKQVEEGNEGLSALDRGNIVHQLMEYFWREVKNQQTLISLNEKQIIDLLNKHTKKIENELSEDFNKHKLALSIELKRAQEAALLFLEIEKKRSPFEVIGFEEKQEQNIKGLKLSLRVDRIDKLEDGSQLIIDYKSSPSYAYSWLSPRIDEPQLPIYLMNNSNAEAIAFGVINKNSQELGFKGIASNALGIPGVIDCQDDKKNKRFATQWDDILKEWRNDIENHANNFMQGINFVDPKNTNTSCTYCEFSSICRVNELNIDTNEDDLGVSE